MNEIIALFIGFGLGAVWMANRKQPVEELSVDDIDLKLRNELAVAKNLNESLLQDKRALWEENRKLKEKQ